jgi:trans-2,3-dihydro-3-hydroxyanthranilate isomerase
MHHYAVVDVFTSIPLQGNPVAVFLDASDLPAERMQRIAREMNLSETTFVLPPQRSADARVRIFTPVNELPFAGHPLLGTAVLLGTSRPANEIRLETAMGVIPFELEFAAGGGVSARMQQPIPTWRPYDHARELLAALGVRDAQLPVDVYHNGPHHVFVALADEEALNDVRPDLRALGALPDMAANCFAGSGSSWTMRMFSPAYGVAEDAATGSAAGPLAVHLARHGLIGFGDQIEIRQGLQIGRPARMLAKVQGTVERIAKVEVAGDAVVVGRGSLYV